MATIRIFPKIITSLSSSNPTYATATAGSSVGIYSSNSAAHGQAFQFSQRVCLIGFMAFDTSIMAGLGTITDATFSTNSATDRSATDFTSNIRLHDFGANVDAADWLTPAVMATKTLLATYNTSGGLTGTKTWTSVALAANINTTGETRVVTSSSRYESSSLPTGLEDIYPAYTRSYIDITYTPNPSSPLTLITPSDTDTAYINSSGSDIYSLVRAGNALSVTQSFGISAGYIGQSGYADKFGTNYTVNQFFIRFDTSILAGAASITSAVLKIQLQQDFSDTDFDIEARLATWTPPLQTTDYIPGASMSSKTLLAHLNTSGVATGTYISFIDDAMVANLNLSGYTGMVLTSNRFVAGTIPANGESVNIDWTSTGVSAKLEVVANFGSTLATYSTRMMGFIGS